MKIFFTVFGIISAILFYFAEYPKFLEELSIERPEQNQVNIPVTLKEPPKEEKEAPKELEKSDLDALRPASFQIGDDVKSFGVAFGSGGGGLAIAGGGSLDSGLLSQVTEDTSVTKKAQIIQKSNPEYPSEAKSRGIKGDVYLKILVEKDGKIGGLKIEASNPPGIFDEAVLRAVRSWSFGPALEKGKPIASWIGQKIRFELE